MECCVIGCDAHVTPETTSCTNSIETRRMKWHLQSLTLPELCCHFCALIRWKYVFVAAGERSQEAVMVVPREGTPEGLQAGVRVRF